MEQELPPNKYDDWTLEQVALDLGDTEAGKALAGHTKFGMIVVRFIRQPEETDLPWAMKLREFRQLAREKKARMEISDGSGGQKAKPRVPELT